MSNIVDERVVEMRFDNKDFEKNVKESMSTIDKLKEKLQFKNASKSFDEIEKASKDVSFEQMAGSVQMLENRFSALGIVGKRVLENLTDAGMRAVGNISKTMISSITEGGKRRAFNLANAQFQLEGLFSSAADGAEKVEAIMKNVNESVDGTAYSLDAAATVAAQLAASGMEAGDNMLAALRGIAGVASMTNSTYEDIGRIFTSVAGNGRLMGDQLLQLSSRGMNAAATIAKYLGVTEAEVREMTSKGMIDFETFSAAMDDAFGEHAKAANETFQGSMSNIKAALARIGALFYSPLITKEGPLVKLLNSVREKINDIKTALIPLADTFTTCINSMVIKLNSFLSKMDIARPIRFLADKLSSPWSKFKQRIEETGITMEDFQNRLIEIGDANNLGISKIIEKYGSLDKAIKKGKISAKLIIDTIKSFTTEGYVAGKTATELSSKFEELGKVTKEVIRGDYGNGEERIKRLTKANQDYYEVQSLVNYIWKRNGKTWKNCDLTLDEITKVLGKLSKEELKNTNLTESQIEALQELAKEAEKTGTPITKLIDDLYRPTPKELIFESIANVLQSIKAVFDSFKEAWKETVTPLKLSGDIFYDVAEKIRNFTNRIKITDERAAHLTSIFKGLLAILDMVRSIVSGAISVAFKMVSAVLKGFGYTVLEACAKVGELIAKLRDWWKEHDILHKIIDKFIELVEKASKAVSEWVKENEHLQNVASGIRNIFTSLVNVISGFTDKISSIKDIPGIIIESLKMGIQSGIPKVVNVVLELGKSIIEALRDALDIHSPSPTIIDIGMWIIKSLIIGIKKMFGSLKIALGDIGSAMSKFLYGFDYTSAAVIGLTGGFLYVLYQLVKTLQSIAKPLSAVGDLFKSIDGVLDAVADMAKAKALQYTAKAILTFAFAIAVLAVSFAALVYVIGANGENTKAAMYAMIFILGALLIMTGLFITLAALAPKLKIAGVKCLFTFSAILLSFGVVVGAMAGLVYILGKVGPEEYNNIMRSMDIIVQIVFGLMVLIALISLLPVNVNVKIDHAATVFLGLSLALLGLAVAIKMMSTIEVNGGDIEKPIEAILLFIMGLMGLMAVMGNSKAFHKGSADVLLAAAGACLILAIAIKMIGKIPGGELAKGIVTIGFLFAFMAALSKLSTKSGKNIVSAGSMLIGFAVAVGLLIICIKLISFLSAEEIIKGLFVIGVFAAFAYALIKASTYVGRNAGKAGASFIAFAGAVFLLIVSIKLIGTISIYEILKGAAVITAFFFMFKTILKLSKNIDKDVYKSSLTFIGMAAAIIILVGAMYLMSGLDIVSIIKGTAAISAMLYMFSILFKSMDNVFFNANSFKSFIVICVMIGLVMASLIILSKMDYKCVIAAGAAISAVLFALSFVLKASKVAKFAKEDFLGLLQTLAIMVLVIAALGGVIILMTKLGDPSAMMQVSEALSMVIISFSIMIAATSLLAKFSKGSMVEAAAAILLMSVVVGVISGAIVTISKMDNIPSPKKMLSICELLLTLASMVVIVSLIGKIGPEGVLIGVAGVLLLTSGIAAMIGAFGVIADLIDDHFGDGTVAAKMERGIEIMAQIGDGLGRFFGGIVNGFGQVFSSGFETIANKLGGSITTLFDSLEPVFDKLSNVDDPLIAEKLESFAKGILELSEASFIMAFTPMFGEEEAEPYEKMADGMVKFLGAFDDVKFDNLDQIVELMEGLGRLQASMPRSGGLWKRLAGEKEGLDEFGKDIEGLGEGLVSFVEECKAIMQIGPTKAANSIYGFAEVMGALGELNELQHQLEEDGVWQWFTGRKSYKDFAAGLNELAPAILEINKAANEMSRSFYIGEGFKIQNGLNLDQIQKIAGAIQILGSITNFIPKSGGFLSVFKADRDLSTFGRELKSFGPDFQEFYNSVSGIDGPKLTGVCEGLKTLITAISSLKGFDQQGVNEFCSAVNRLTGTNFQKFYDNMSVGGKEASEKAAGDLKNIANDVSNYMNNQSKDVEKAGKGTTKVINESISGKEASKSYEKSGNTVTASLAKGIESHKSKAGAATKKVSKAAQSSVTWPGLLNRSGKEIANGLASGISSNQSRYKCNQSIELLAKGLKKSFTVSVQVHSPSRVFMRYGGYIVDGLVNGIKNYTGKAIDTARDLGNTVTTSFSDTISSIGMLMNSDLDMDPTIRPVMDLSGISDGIRSANNMLNLSNINASVDGINAMINGRIQNEKSIDIVGAIKDLQSELGKTGNTYNSINGVTYDDGSNISEAIGTIVRAVQIEGRS